MLGFIQQLQRRTPLGWLQLTRHKGRFLVALSGIAFADILMFMQLGFQSSLFESNTRLNRSVLADIVLISSQAKSTQNLSTFPRNRLFEASDVPGVKAAEPMYIGMVSWRNPQTKKKVQVTDLGGYATFKITVEFSNSITNLIGENQTSVVKTFRTLPGGKYLS